VHVLCAHKFNRLFFLFANNNGFWQFFLGEPGIATKTDPTIIVSAEVAGFRGR